MSSLPDNDFPPMIAGMQPNLQQNMAFMLGNISTQIFCMAQIVEAAFPDPEKPTKRSTWTDYIYLNSSPEQLAVQYLTQINDDLTRINQGLTRALPRIVRQRPDETGRWAKVGNNSEEM